jgi:hypothetical protein
MPQVDAAGTKLYFEDYGYGHPIIFFTSWDPTIGNGRTRFAIFAAPIVALRTTPVVIRQATSPRISFIDWISN